MEFDSVQFNKNNRKARLEVLDQYFGQQVAWSLDGTRIIAHAPTLEELLADLERRGITEYVHDWTLSGESLGPNFMSGCEIPDLDTPNDPTIR